MEITAAVIGVLAFFSAFATVMTVVKTRGHMED